jgi:O-antigen/teichoic acid export membrane protein
VSDPAPQAALTTRRGSAVVRSGLLSMVGLVALGGARLVHGSLVSHATDHETYARVGTLIGLAMTVSLIFPAGLASAASRYISFHIGAGDRATASAAYRVLTLAGGACALLLAALVGALATLLPGVSSADVAAVALLTAVYAGYSVAKGALYGFDRLVAYTWLEVTGSLVTVGATAIVVTSGAHAYLVPFIIGNAVLMLGSPVILRASRERVAVAGSEAPRARPPARLDIRELAVWVGLASLGGGASGGLLQILPVLAGRFTTQVQVAYFVAAVTLVAPLLFLPRALSLALFPAMARAHGAGDVDVVRRHADISTRALLALLAPIFAAGIFLAPEVLLLFGGGQYIDGAPVLRLLLLATFTGAVQVAAVNSLSSGDAVRIPVYASVAGAVVGLLVLVPLGHWFASMGVGAAYLLAVAITATVPIAATWRRYRMAWTGPVTRSFAVVVVALVVAELLGTSRSGADRIGLDALCAAATLVASWLILRRDIAAVLAARHRA